METWPCYWNEWCVLGYTTYIIYNTYIYNKEMALCYLTILPLRKYKKQLVFKIF